MIKLKEVLERQQFEIVIQARVNTKVLSKERIAPYRKGNSIDCLWLYGVIMAISI